MIIYSIKYLIDFTDNDLMINIRDITQIMAAVFIADIDLEREYELFMSDTMKNLYLYVPRAKEHLHQVNAEKIDLGRELAHAFEIRASIQAESLLVPLRTVA